MAKVARESRESAVVWCCCYPAAAAVCYEPACMAALCHIIIVQRQTERERARARERERERERDRERERERDVLGAISLGALCHVALVHLPTRLDLCQHSVTVS